MCLWYCTVEEESFLPLNKSTDISLNQKGGLISLALLIIKRKSVTAVQQYKYLQTILDD